jgi:hypothetical protein
MVKCGAERPYRENILHLGQIAAELAELQDWAWDQGLDACLSYVRHAQAGYVLTITDGDVSFSIDWWHYGGDPRSRKFGRSFRLWSPSQRNLRSCVRRTFFG